MKKFSDKGTTLAERMDREDDSSISLVEQTAIDTAITLFCEIYDDPKQRSDRKKWKDYLVSKEFLKVWRQPRFTAAIYKAVMDRTEMFPPHKNLIKELCIAYGVRYAMQEQEEEYEGIKYYYEPVILPNAEFYGIEQILGITDLGEPITYLSHTEERMRAAGFLDYMALLSLAEEGWKEENLEKFQEIIKHYYPEYITDRPANDRSSEFYIQKRDPSALKLLTFFFSDKSLPAKAYQMAWDIMHLENVISGSRKKWYEDLAKAIKPCLPEQIPEDKTAMLAADKAYCEYRTRSFIREGKDFAQDKEEVDALFARDDFQYSLLVPHFAEKVRNYWLDMRKSWYFLEKIKEFCQSHLENEEAKKILEQAEQLLKRKQADRENKEDEEGEIRTDLEMSNRPFWRYFLTRAFPMAPSLKESKELLSSWLSNELRLSDIWLKRFLKFDEEQQNGSVCTSISIDLEDETGKSVLEIVFRMHFIEYRFNEQAVWEPLFTWEKTKEILEDSKFWLLLPMTFAFWERRKEVEEELKLRLVNFPIPEELKEKTADFLTGYLCTRRVPEDIVFFTKQETAEHLYGYMVSKEGELTVFEEFMDGWNILQKKEAGAFLNLDAASCMNRQSAEQAKNALLDMAKKEGERCLEELTNIGCGLEIPYMQNPPLWVEASLVCGAFVCYVGNQVTLEKLRNLLAQFLDGKLKRLEFTWSEKDRGNMEAQSGNIHLAELLLTEKSPAPRSDFQSLVFRMEDEHMVCLYFNDIRRSWYGYISMLDAYYEDAAREEKEFGLAVIPNYLIHDNTSRIRKMIPQILEELGETGGNLDITGFQNWSIMHSWMKPLPYNRSKRELGGFPAFRARNSWIYSGIELTCRPAEVLAVDLEGQEQKENGPVPIDMVLYHLGHYFRKKLKKLELVWKWREGEAWESKILLLQDKGLFWMMYTDERERCSYCLVADVQAYLNADGKTRKASFLGEKKERYLLHKDPATIKDGLDLLLPNIKNPKKIIHQLGQWAPECK